jgi:hypothetical protein
MLMTTIAATSRRMSTTSTTILGIPSKSNDSSSSVHKHANHDAICRINIVDNIKCSYHPATTITLLPPSQLQ